MDAVMETKLCDEKHKNIDHTLEEHDKRLNDHANRLDRLENGQTRTETIVQNLCNQLKALTTAIWWFIGLTITIGTGFIIWFIQTH